jgi:uncharacterized protein
MKKLFCIIILFIAQTLHAQSLPEVAGYWEGFIEITGQNLGINFTFSYADGELDGTMDIPQQQAYNLPVEFTKADADSLIFQFETGTGPALFRGKWNYSDQRIDGNFEQMGLSFPFSIRKGNGSLGDDLELNEQNLVIPTRAGQISGTLLLTENPSPLIILITGSGSQDRNETVAGFRVFAELSQQLFSSGFSTFRYDDRGVGQSEGPSDATLFDMADDLTDIIQYLDENHTEEFTEIILLGHSQGGLVATLTASMSERISGVVYMGAPFLRGDEVINQQIKIISSAQGIEEDIVEKNLEFQSRIYEIVRSGGEWNELEEDLADRLQTQINALPEAQREALGDMSSFVQSQINRQLAGAKTEWFKSFIEFDPAELMAQSELPMLAIFAEKDAQVVMEPNQEAAVSLKEEAGILLEIVVIEEANHLFQKANTGMPSEYGMLEKEFADGFVDAIVEWLRAL